MRFAPRGGCRRRRLGSCTPWLRHWGGRSSGPHRGRRRRGRSELVSRAQAQCGSASLPSQSTGWAATTTGPPSPVLVATRVRPLVGWPVAVLRRVHTATGMAPVPPAQGEGAEQGIAHRQGTERAAQRAPDATDGNEPKHGSYTEQRADDRRERPGGRWPGPTAPNTTPPP